MDLTITPRKLQGAVSVIPSKSQAHRLLICAAFADAPTKLLCPETSRDMEATAGCLRALGAQITRTQDGYEVQPCTRIPESAVLPCHDSGSTLRFLLPIAGALGIDATFLLEGRLAQRPLSPLWEEMTRMGCTLSRPSDNTIHCCGRLLPGTYCIDGSVSSQFITGPLLALPLLKKESRITVLGKLESLPYVRMTQQAMTLFGVDTEGFHITGEAHYRSPGILTVEGDWSNGAFFLSANALGSKIYLHNLSPESCQGDKAICSLLEQMNGRPVISAADVPDLIPILCVVAAIKHGAEFTDIRRLRLKESDRVAAILSMLHSLGGKAEAGENTLTVFPTGLTGGTVDSVNDHRIAMSAAIASTVCTGTVTILGAQCVDKSYPRFWEIFRQLGGSYEQYIR